MQKLLRNAIIAIMSVMALSASAAKTTVLGYCNDEISASDYRHTINATYQAMACIRIPASRLAAIKGGDARLTKIRFGSEAGLTNAYVWVRTSLTETAAVMQRLGTTKEGWNEVTLATPYSIGDDDLYIGINATMKKGTALILNGTTSPDGALVSLSGEWEDLSAEGKGSLCLQGIMESDNEMPTADLGIESVSTAAKYIRNGTTHRFDVKLSNYGTTDMAVPACHYRLGSGAAHDIAPAKTTTLKPGESCTLSFDTLIDGLAEGATGMKVWFDGDDEAADNNTFDKTLFVYSKTYAHKMLLEQFTTLQCVACPRGLKVLEALVDGHKDIVWVAHHVGFGSDQFTIKASQDIMTYGISSAPRAMFDRSIVSASEGNRPSFGIGYSVEAGLYNLRPAMEETLARPAFASVGIESAYDAGSRSLTVKVSGERNGLYEQLYKNTNLTVYLIEDSCVSRRQQTGGTAADTIHNNVVRAVLTESLGNAVSWDGDTYAEEFHTTLPATWKAKDVRVVAFIHRPVSEGYTNCEVLNAEMLDITTQTTGITTPASGGSGKTVKTYYNLQGQRLAQRPQSGIYIEQTRNGSTVSSVKRVAGHNHGDAATDF